MNIFSKNGIVFQLLYDFVVFNPLHATISLFSRRNLIKQFAWREVVARYRGTYLGLLWSFLNPLLMLGVYTLVFGVILRARFSSEPNENMLFFAVNLFCGLLIYDVFSTCLLRAPSLIFLNSNYVTKVVFPLEILPVAVLASSLVQAALGFTILIPVVILCTPNVSAWTLFFPVVFIPLCGLVLGLSWFLASIGVFLRDIGHSVAIFIQFFFFVSPIIFPASAAPPLVRPYLGINPLTGILENARAMLILGNPPDWSSLARLTLYSLVIMQIGYMWFMKSKKAFADVL